MPKQPLAEHFMPVTYKISAAEDGLLNLEIKGKRVGRPSKRLVLHQKNLKIKSAGIIYYSKNKSIEYEVVRINHLPTFQQVRLHTAQQQYPGDYEIRLLFAGTSIGEIKELLQTDFNNAQISKFLPSIDEPAAKQAIKIEVA